MITLLITTRNRTDLLHNSLLRWSGLTKPGEIIVVDDGGTDECRGVCMDWAESLPLRYVHTDHPGDTNCCHARNVGLKMARFPILLTAEPEVWPISDVVPQMMRVMALPTHHFWHPETCWHEKEAGGYPDKTSKEPGWPFMNAWDTKLLRYLGGWDESFPGPWGWDDIDLHERLRHLGYLPMPVSGSQIIHQWHKSRIEPAAENEQHCRAKDMPRDLVANRGLEWGVPK